MEIPNTVREIHDQFDAGRMTPLSLTEEYLKRISTSRINAYLTVCNDRALAQARRATKILAEEGRVLRKERPLFGIPLGIKDVIHVEGVRTTCASKMLENYIPPYTSTAVERLEKAGAITLGKLNMDEFAMGASNENSAFGDVDHPTHPGYVPGGSSGGSAAAVKAGLCFASLGTDTGGSIRLPASFCGVVGFKPTYARVSRYGLVAFASSLDQIGPLTTKVEDTARMLDVLCGVDPMDMTTAPVEKGNLMASLKAPIQFKNLRVGIPDEYVVDALQPEVRAGLDRAIEWFKKSGAEIVKISLPHTKYAIAVYYLVAVSEACSNLARYDGIRFGTRPELSDKADLQTFYKKARSFFGPEVKRRIILGTFALSSGYSDAYYRKACQVRALIQKDFLEAFGRVDVLLGPVAPSTAFERGSKSKDPLQMYLVDIFTCPTNLAGLPAVSLPWGEDKKGLPVGLQLIAPHFCEDRLLSLSQALENFQESGA